MAATCITFHKIGLTAGLALTLSSMAPSTSVAYSARAQQMCMSDAMRLCSSEIPSISRITSCMRRNKANVSPGCRAVMDEMDGTAARARTPEQKPAAVARTQPPAAPRPMPVPQKPAAAPVVAQPAATETRPSEQKLPVASRVAQPATTSPPTQAAPDAQASAGAPPVAQAVAAEAAPVQAAPPTQTPSLGSLASIVVNAVQTASAEREQAVAAPREAPPAIETKPLQSVPDGPTPAVMPPVAQPNSAEVKAVDAKPAQAATVEHKATISAPADVKPAAAKSVAGSKPVTTVARKQKQRQVRMARYDHRDADIDRAMAIALPMLSAIMQSW
jgi:hypothetical protein